MGYIEGQDRYQVILFPESIDDYIGENSSVRVIDEFVEQLDLEVLGFKRCTCYTTGRPPYNPKDLLKLYIYGYLNRIRSSRRLESETGRNIEVIWLLKKLTPDFKTIADFRKDNKKALKAVFRDFVKLCDEWDLFGKELVAIDGTKLRASNSKKNNYSAKKLERLVKYIDAKVDKYLEKLDQCDKEETCDRQPDAEEIKKRLQELKQRKEKYEGYKEQLEISGTGEISTVDPDARLMCNNNNNVDMGYNVQTTVDSKHKLIIDFKVTQNPNDLGELDNMALRAKKIFEDKQASQTDTTFEVVADKGYYKVEDLKKCVKNGITPYVAKQIYSNGTGDKDFYTDRFKYDKELDVYICPAGQSLSFYRNRRSAGKTIGRDYRNKEACKECVFKDRCTKSEQGRSIYRHADQDFLDTIDLQTELNKDKYRLRQTIVEHPFGTVKRSWGAYFFLTRRKISVATEVSITFLSYNLKRVMNILGNTELLRRLRERRKLVLG